MEIWMYVVAGIVALLLIGGVVFLFVKVLPGRKKSKVMKLDHIADTELGTCSIRGDTDEFEVSFAGTKVCFLVQNGIITGYRDNINKEYTMYQADSNRAKKAGL